MTFTMNFMEKNSEREQANPKIGDVFLATVNFSDLSGEKVRPIIIVASDPDDEDKIAVFLTSSGVRTEFDVPLEYWKEAGLVKPSFARAAKLLNIHPTRCKKHIGTLNVFDLERLLDKCQRLFSDARSSIRHSSDENNPQ